MAGLVMVAVILAASLGYTAEPQCPSFAETQPAPQESAPIPDEIICPTDLCNIKRPPGEGLVVLDVIVGPDGRATKVEVVSSKPKGKFDALAICQMQHWPFERRVRATLPSCYRRQVPVEFKVEAPQT